MIPIDQLADYATQQLALFTIIAHIGTVILLAVLAHNKLSRRKVLKGTIRILRKNALALAFAVALFSTLGSLFYSNIVGYVPCTMCWIQRAFLFPQVLILGAALTKKLRNTYRYIIPMSIAGAGAAAIHYIMQLKNIQETVVCTAATTASCTESYLQAYGYITMPMMSLTAFVIIAILSYMGRRRQSSPRLHTS